MRLLVLYATCGLLWVFGNFIFVALHPSGVGERIIPKYLEAMHTAAWWVGIAMGIVFWPALLLFTIYPDAFGSRVKDAIQHSFRRAYVDGPTWNRVLADPPRPLPIHYPALGCDGLHGFEDPCPCLAKCETCGSVCVTDDAKKAWELSPTHLNE